MRETLQELGEYVQAALPEQVVSVFVTASRELIVNVSPCGLLKVMGFLRDDVNCQFKVLVDVSGVDYRGRDVRFDVVYHLLSMKHNQRLRVKVAVDEGVPVPSVVKIYPSAGWYEREVWDLYGVYFSDNPDLRRILTDYGFDGHPQRKDFPLTGYVEMRYDEEKKRVVYEPVKLNQQFRSFDYTSPWEGAPEYLLAEADKEEGVA